MATRQILIASAIAILAAIAAPLRAQDAAGVTRQDRAAIDALLAASAHGLDPGDYDAWTLDSLARGIGPAAVPDRVQIDALLSASMIAYLQDLHSGRVHFAPFARPVDDVDWASALRQAMAGDSIERLVAASEPHLTQYRNLRLLLQRYRRLASEPSPPLLPHGPLVRPGQPYGASEALRTRLEWEGDLPSAVRPFANPGLYDDELARGIRHFQWRYGLTDDGILGEKTIEALNTPFSSRVRQIELALERLRWLPQLGAHRFVVVNIPAFQLFAFDSTGGTGAPSLTMRVVVGKALDTRTPMLFEQMRYIEFRPFWNVPRSILVRELLPQLRRHPEYLRQHRMEAVGKAGQLFGDSVSRDILARLVKGELRVRQKPGPSNALGLVKFAFPNAAGVYMHGTPETDLFSQARRDFSHGCIRVERPEALAAWLLHERPWTLDSIFAAMHATETRRVSLARSIPVAVFYTTVVAMPDGEARFYPDVYGNDQALDELLRHARSATAGVAAALPVR